MERELRIKKLKEIQDNETPFMTGIRVKYKGDVKEFKAYKIPLEFLIYNKYNGRIGSVVKTYEKQFHELNAENDEHNALIEGFLWDSKKDRNEETMRNIVENGQQKNGIVTSDGVIIDGNRRAMLLNKIHSDRKEWTKKGNDVEKCQYFLAIILPEDADPKEIQRLETTYQMGEDAPVDYNPIEKYLKIKDLTQWFTPIDIAKMMSEDEVQIKERIEVMKLMDSYLAYLGYEGIYTRLDQTEDHLLNLNNWIKRYAGSDSDIVKWEYDELDVNELKLLSFDYIRARHEGKEFRSIGKPSVKESIFCKSKDLWSSFLDEHKKKIRNIPEKTVEEIRSAAPDEQLSKLTEARDAEWTQKAKDSLKGNLGKNMDKLQDLNDANQPLELIKKALNALTSINTEVEQFYEDDEIHEKLKEVNTLSFEYIRKIKKFKPAQK